MQEVNANEWSALIKTAQDNNQIVVALFTAAW